MMKLEYVRETLQEGGYTCVLFYDGELVLASYEKGITPLYSYVLHRKEILNPLILGDKVIGRAAALLAAYAGVKQLYTGIISEGAIKVLQHHGVAYEYERIVPYIENRNKDGQCPMELTVEHIVDSQEGFIVLKNFIEKHKKK